MNWRLSRATVTVIIRHWSRSGRSSYYWIFSLSKQQKFSNNSWTLTKEQRAEGCSSDVKYVSLGKHMCLSAATFFFFGFKCVNSVVFPFHHWVLPESNFSPTGVWRLTFSHLADISIEEKLSGPEETDPVICAHSTSWSTAALSKQPTNKTSHSLINQPETVTDHSREQWVKTLNRRSQIVRAALDQSKQHVKVLQVTSTINIRIIISCINVDGRG